MFGSENHSLVLDWGFRSQQVPTFDLGTRRRWETYILNEVNDLFLEKVTQLIYTGDVRTNVSKVIFICWVSIESQNENILSVQILKYSKSNLNYIHIHQLIFVLKRFTFITYECIKNQLMYRWTK